MFLKNYLNEERNINNHILKTLDIPNCKLGTFFSAFIRSKIIIDANKNTCILCNPKKDPVNKGYSSWYLRNKV